MTAIRRWWVIALAVFLGGLAGLGFHALRPTVYEARFEVLLGLDQVNSGELERFEEDAALDAAGVILGGPNTLWEVADSASKSGVDITQEELARMATVERRRTTWMVRLRDTDPQRVEALASIWLKTGYGGLLEAYQHALQADALQGYLASLESCLARTAHSSPAEGLCGAGNLLALQEEIRRSGDLLAQELEEARGLPGFVLVGRADLAVLPPQPVANGRGTMVLAGAVIGLAIGVWLTQMAAPRKQER